MGMWCNNIIIELCELSQNINCLSGCALIWWWAWYGFEDA